MAEKLETKMMKEVKTVLSKFGNKYIDDNGVLSRQRVVDDLDHYDKDLMKALLADQLIHDAYTEKVLDTEVFKLNEFISMFEYKEFWGNSFTNYVKRIGLASEDKFIEDSSDVVLDFPFKDAVLKAGMTREDTDEDEEELFLNDTLAQSEINELYEPKILVNAKKYDINGEHAATDFSDDDNLVIKGNNLIALHSIKKRYAGKVKLILIDPPYNTGSDSFKYNDDFNQAAWLTFMKNRLEISQELLSDDGAILISIDENEEAYLKVLLDEIMRPENFLANFHIQVRYTNKSLNEKNDFQPVMEYVLAYAKNKETVTINKPYKTYDLSKFEWQISELGSGKSIELGGKKVTIYQPDEYTITKVAPNIDNLKETWASGSVLKGNTSGKFFNEYLSKRKDIDGLNILYKVEGIGEDGLGYRYFTGPKKKTSIRGKFYSGVPLDVRDDIKNNRAKKYYPIVNYYDFSGDYGNIRQEGGVAFNGGKKPEKMLAMFIERFTNPKDIIMDFHLGSGSTIATAHKLNRRYIGIEQMDYISNVVKRMNSVIHGDKTGISNSVDWQGGGSFIYAELMEKNQKYMDDIQAAENMSELDAIYNRMKENADLDFRLDLQKYENDPETSELSLIERKKVLMKMLDKNRLYYNEANIDDANVRKLVSTNDYEFNKSFYDQEY